MGFGRMGLTGGFGGMGSGGAVNPWLANLPAGNGYYYWTDTNGTVGTAGTNYLITQTDANGVTHPLIGALA